MVPDIHFDNDMNINIHLDINTNIDIIPSSLFWKNIWYLEVDIECVAYKMTHLTHSINYLIYKKTYLSNKVLNRAL